MTNSVKKSEVTKQTKVMEQQQFMISTVKRPVR